MTEPTQAIKNVHSVGGMGLDYLGMPPSTGSGSAGSRDWYLHRTLYAFEQHDELDDENPDAETTYSSLHAELLILQTLGLILIEQVHTPIQSGGMKGIGLEVWWRYTDEGAKAVIESWHRVHGEYPSSYAEGKTP